MIVVKPGKGLGFAHVLQLDDGAVLGVFSVKVEANVDLSNGREKRFLLSVNATRRSRRMAAPSGGIQEISAGELGRIGSLARLFQWDTARSVARSDRGDGQSRSALADFIGRSRR